MSAQNQGQNHNQAGGPSSGGGAGGQRHYAPGASVTSYEDFLRTNPAPWAGGPPLQPQFQQWSQQTQGKPNNGATGPGYSTYGSTQQR